MSEQEPVREAVRAYAARQPDLRAATRALRGADPGPARRRGHQLPQRHRPHQERRVLRGEGRPHRRRPGSSTPTRSSRSPTRSASASSPTSTATWRRSPSCSTTSSPSSTTATWARRRPAPAASATPVGTCWSTVDPGSDLRRPGGAPRERAGAHGPAARVGRVRARHPLQGHRARGRRPRPRPALHPRRRAARARRPGVLHDPRATPGRRAAPARRGGPERPAHQRAGARDLPGRAVRRRRAGRTPTTTAGSPGCSLSSASPRSTSSPRCSPPSTPTPSSAGWATATPPAPYAASTTRCSRSSVQQYVDLDRQRHRVPLLTRPAGEAEHARDLIRARPHP